MNGGGRVHCIILSEFQLPRLAAQSLYDRHCLMNHQLTSWNSAKDCRLSSCLVICWYGVCRLMFSYFWVSYGREMLGLSVITGITVEGFICFGFHGCTFTWILAFWVKLWRLCGYFSLFKKVDCCLCSCHHEQANEICWHKQHVIQMNSCSHGAH